jgi:hypothetical protein
LRLALLGMREAGDGRVVVHFDETDPAAGPWTGESADAAMPQAEEILVARWSPAASGGSARDAQR